ncbi:hypothetical protein HO173_005137 [Letharia columbiana]|uniref:Rhodopsin domain-containing protein n=1 Tax=Letharia columbiana TaxID=112416 RepID=A0A8H6L613_9LECA|nr:uncharacterized protein HO173_005137 [Letharia columbiana]KAF6236846.1 hypothetical protein HO173_005137 [Letharia columbiana]
MLLLGSVVLASGIPRIVSFRQLVQFTDQNQQEYIKDTLWYTAGPLFWGFAENPIAIIGACLPTLAPLWSKQHRSTPKGWSYLKNLWKSFSSSSYEDLEGYYQNTNNAEHASISRLVTPGPATDIHAEDIALADMPQEGIQVLTTLSSNYKK